MEPQKSKQTTDLQSEDKTNKVQKSDVLDSTTHNYGEPVESKRFIDQEDTTSQLLANKAKTSKSDFISWTASEFVDHNKNASWYLRLMLIALVLAALVFIATHDKISTGAVIVAAILLGIYATHKPRVLEYELDDSGLKIGDKSYSYGTFKSFSIMDEGERYSIYLLPLKRFMPAISIYYDQINEKKIVDILSDKLPHEERKTDLVDSLMHHVRF